MSCTNTEKLFNNIFKLFWFFVVAELRYCIYFRVRTRNVFLFIYVSVN